MSDNSYQLAKQGSEIDSILTNAAADHNKIGAASGIAPLGADGKVPDANLPSYAPLGADGKVPAANLPDNDATLRFSAVERVAGATITDGTATGSFEVVWLDNRALATSHPYTAPTAEEKEVQGRFVAKKGSGIQLTEASGGDVSTTTYYANWAGRDAFCNSVGKPLKNRLYLCTATGRQYDKFPGNNSTGLRCIAAPPMDAKKALFNDLWNEACKDQWGSAHPYGYYDADADTYILNGLTLTYAEALAVYDAGKVSGTGDYHYCGNRIIRTNLPPQTTGTVGGGIPVTMKGAFARCVALEVAITNGYVHQAAFDACNNLVEVKGVIGRPKGNLGASPKLTTISIKLDPWAGDAFSLAGFPLLSVESLDYLITNAQATTQGTRTVTLHADAYARLTDDMKARAAEKSITFVCAS